jgi:hypothetical protein
MTDRQYGLNIHAHGSTEPKSLCFIPPIFTKVIMAENYGKMVVNKQCHYTTIPTNAFLNNPAFSFIGFLEFTSPIKGGSFTDLTIYQKTGIFLCHDKPSANKYTNYIDANNHNIFAIQKTDTQDSNINRLLDYLSCLTINIKEYVTPQIFVPGIDYKTEQIKHVCNLIEIAYKTDSDEYKGLEELKTLGDIDARYSLMAIRLANKGMNDFYTAFNLTKPTNESELKNILFQFSNIQTIITYANKLLFNKVIGGYVPKTSNGSHQNILSILKKSTYYLDLAKILATLKCELIESRLKHKLDTPFTLRCIACRGIESQDTRIQPYKNIVSQPQYETIFDPSRKVAKSTKHYTLGNTANSVNNMISGGFEGYLKPNIVIHEVLYPLFLYVINPKSTVFSKHISSDVMNNLIKSLANYEIEKSNVLIVLHQISSNVISDVVDELNAKFGQEKSPNHAMFEDAFKNLITMYSYTVEDIIITFGLIIKNFNDYIQINQGVFRTFSSLAPEEYANNIPNSPVSKTSKTSKNRKGINKANKAKTIKGVKPTKPTYSEMLMGNKGLAISILSGKSNYLSKMVKDNKSTYLPLLFDMVDVV